MDRKMSRKVRETRSSYSRKRPERGQKCRQRLELSIHGLKSWGMVQTQVTAQGCLGSTPEGRRPQIRGWRAGGSLAVSSPTPATPLLSPAKIRDLNHAAFASLSYPTDRQVVRN